MFLMLMMTISEEYLVEICATSEVILIVLVLYFLAPPTRDYTDVITHVNPRKNQSKP